MTLDQKNRLIAESLGWQYRPAFNSEGAFSTTGPYWHHPDCKDMKGHKDCGASEINFYTSEDANAMLLETMPEPAMRKYIRSGNDPEMWRCLPNVFGEIVGVGPDRKTAICEAYLAYKGLNRKEE